MKIFKQTLKNYLKGLRFVFTPIGIVSIFVIIGFSIMIPGILNACKTMVEQVAKELSEIKIDWKEVGGEFVAFLKGLDWKNPSSVIAQFNADYLKTHFLDILRNVYPEIDTKIEAISTAVNNCVAMIGMYIAIFIILIVVGFVVGYFVTRWLIRRDIAHRKWFFAILFAIVDAIICVIVLYAASKLYKSMGNNYIWILGLILLGLSIYSLFEAWLIQGIKKVKLGKVLNIKNVIFLILGHITIILIGLVATFLISLAKMPVLTIVIALSLFVVTQVVITFNAEGYVRELAGEVTIKEKDKKIKKLEKENAELKAEKAK